LLAGANVAAVSIRIPPSVFEDYLPCGVCTALVLRSRSQVLPPEEIHHSNEELVTFDQCRQMQ
jgi:hypothetical protein